VSTFDPRVLLGKAETYRLEFKAADILKKPVKVAREVVAFLNADGGDLWVGVGEEEGRAVRLETISDIEGELSRLRDHLLDTIEPVVRIPGDVRLTSEGGLLHVAVVKGQHPPYAQRDGGRHFWIRADARLRDMSREEIARAFNAPIGNADRLTGIVRDLLRAQAEEGAARPSLWIRLVLTEPLSIDFTDTGTKVQFESWLRDPSATGNRRSGWNFVNDYARPKFLYDHVEQGDPDSPSKIRITNRGEITYSVSRDALYWKGDDSDPRDIWPYSLLEVPASIFRLAGKVFDSDASGSTDLQVVVGFALSGIRGWRLRPGSPREPHLPWKKAQSFDSDLLEADPGQLVFPATEIIRNPDRCCLRLIRIVYGKFGFEDEDIPREFDKQEGVLRLG